MRKITYDAVLHRKRQLDIDQTDVEITGGTITGVTVALDTYYAEMAIIDNASATVINGNEQWQALTTYVVTGMVDGFTYDAGSTGVIASIADATGGDILVTDEAHGLSAGNIITINGCTDSAYNGIFEVLTVPSVDTFTVNAVYTATDTGFWQRGSSLICGVGSAGTYRGQWASSGISSVNAHIFDFAPCVNTTISTKAKARRKFSNDDYGSFSGCALMTVAEGDVITFIVQNVGATGNVTMRTLDLNLVKIK